MRQVRTCDFCGDDASGVYEPLPASIPDAPRMLLCDACRDRLSSVVDPLLAEIDHDSGEGAPRTPGDLEAETSPSEADGGSGADGSTGRPARDDLEDRDWPVDPGDRVDGASEASVDDPAGATDAREGSAGGTGEPSETRPSSIEDLADGERDGASDGTGDAGVEVSESRDAGGRTQRERDGAPRGYRKVMRFLENREFPMDRSEAEHLAAEAYDLDEGAVADAVDHAVQYGRLREVSGELKR